jgi:hypothetical protein
MKFKTCDHLSINKNVTTSMICRNTIFCSIFIHCLTSKKRIKIFKLVNDEIFLNRAFKRFNFDKFCVVTNTFFRFFWIDISAFKMILIHVITCIIMFFNNWWRISIIMISWMFTRLCFRTKHSTSWTHLFFVLTMFSKRCWRIWNWVISCVRNDYLSSRFFRFFDDTWQMMQCWSLFTLIMIICFS